MNSAPRTFPASGIGRIAFSDLPEDLRALLAPRVERLGYLGEFFQVAAIQPEALAGFVTMTEALKEALPHDLAEVVALSAATLLGNDYERCQHEQLAIRLGLDRRWVQEVEALDPDRATLLSELQLETQRLLLALLSSWGHDAAGELDRVVALAGPEAAVGVLLLTGRYAAHAIVANVMALRPPVPSVFEPDGQSRASGPTGAGEPRDA